MTTYVPCRMQSTARCGLCGGFTATDQQMHCAGLWDASYVMPIGVVPAHYHVMPRDALCEVLTGVVHSMPRDVYLGMPCDAEGHGLRDTVASGGLVSGVQWRGYYFAVFCGLLEIGYHGWHALNCSMPRRLVTYQACPIAWQGVRPTPGEVCPHRKIGKPAHIYVRYADITLKHSMGRRLSL